MPIYEYQCRECSERVEKLQKISDAPLVTCPACGRDGLVRLISAAGFRLKGGGWYETDFKKNNRRNLAGDDKPSAGSGGEKSDKSSGKKEASAQTATA
ncbi:MAG: zinc ribbon domain-containing protein [Wenzhouxiangellaceae bacterium]